MSINIYYWNTRYHLPGLEKWLHNTVIEGDLIEIIREVISLGYEVMTYNTNDGYILYINPNGRSFRQK